MFHELFSGQTSGTTVTFVIIDGWTITVASVGDSRCILDAQGGVISALTVDHRLEENVEEWVSVLYLAPLCSFNSILLTMINMSW